jgi:CHAT domain-containing protein
VEKTFACKYEFVYEHADAKNRSVVASLWNVDDASTRELMEEFYQRLAQGEPTSSALHNAKLDLLTRFGDRSPYYWAAFITIGETFAPIQTRRQ